jgi:hypothetical protein
MGLGIIIDPISVGPGITIKSRSQDKTIDPGRSRDN